MIRNLSWAEATCDERLTTITLLKEKKKWFINLLPRRYKLHAIKIRKSSGILSTRTNPTISKPLEITRGWTCCRIGEPQGAKLRESVWCEIMMLLGWKFADELDARSSSCQEEKYANERDASGGAAWSLKNVWTILMQKSKSRRKQTNLFQ